MKTEGRGLAGRPRLQDCGVVITGGTSGVGLASAERFAVAGVSRLALLGRDEGRGQAAKAHVQERVPGTDVHFLPVDAHDPIQATVAFERAVSLLGSVDVLVNSTTGSALPALLHDIPVDEIGEIVTRQALPPMHMTRAALPHMRARRSGVIINIASDAAKVATPGEAVLGAGMAAIVTFSKTTAMEAKRDGIRVNVLTPSLIRGTPTGERVLREGFGAKLFAKAIEHAHLGVAEPEDLAGLVVFLAGPDAALLTGQAISVNGGISAA